MKDRSLDDFVPGDSAETQAKATPQAEAETGDGTETEMSADEEEAEPTDEAALATARWDADGGTCSACGETVERRWRADEGASEFVCADCKEW